MLGRFAVTTAGLLFAVLGWAWLRAESETTQAAPENTVDADYAVDLTSSPTTIDLPASPDGSCDLIVSSLGDSDRTFRVRLQLGTGGEPSPNRLREVTSLQWGRHRSESLQAARQSATAPPVSATCSHAAPDVVRPRTFHLHVTDTPLEDARGYTRIDAPLVAEGIDVRVYCDERVNPSELAPGLAADIVSLLDGRIIPRSREFLGAHADVDGDGKLAVLLTPWLGRLQGGRTSVNGFVRSSDFQPDGTTPYSNRADVLYLNSALQPGSDLMALLAHEYTHAVCCSLRLADRRRPAGLPDEADWLNEAMAHVAERMHGAGWSNLDRRVQSFLKTPHDAPLVVRDYYRAGLWRDPACRGATYLFLQWCVDGYGPKLLRELATTPQTGTEKLEAITGHSFATLHRHWTIALHRGALASLDLHGPLGNCRLAGPHRFAWRAEEGALELPLRGTAVAFVRCVGAESGDKSRRIVVEAPPQARLQVTIAGRAAPRP